MARNRMIKPEFWEDDRICSLPFQTRLFYIALWNFADDEGYVELREAWLKAKCFPYDDANIRRMIDELSNIGRLETSNEILKITNFLKHQRIDRPKPSDLKDRFEAVSTNDRRMIDESSTTKKKVKEVKVRQMQERAILKSYSEIADVIRLTEDEYRKLCQKIGRAKTKAVIAETQDWKLKNTKNMKAWTDDYRGILTWLRSEFNKNKYIPVWGDFNEQDFDSPEEFNKMITKYQ